MPWYQVLDIGYIRLINCITDQYTRLWFICQAWTHTHEKLKGNSLMLPSLSMRVFISNFSHWWYEIYQNEKYSAVFEGNCFCALWKLRLKKKFSTVQNTLHRWSLQNTDSMLSIWGKINCPVPTQKIGFSRNEIGAVKLKFIFYHIQVRYRRKSSPFQAESFWVKKYRNLVIHESFKKRNFLCSGIRVPPFPPLHRLCLEWPHDKIQQVIFSIMFLHSNISQ